MSHPEELACAANTAAPRGPQTISFQRRGNMSLGDHLDWMACSERLSEVDCDSLIETCRAFPETPPRDRKSVV